MLGSEFVSADTGAAYHMKVLSLQLPLHQGDISSLVAGDKVLLTGEMYTGRDAASKRIVQAVAEGRDVPFPIEGAAMYFVGPCPAPPGQVVGSAGPTTSSRMDPYTNVLLDAGLKVMIGKGYRSPEVVADIASHQALYLSAVGGAGALIAHCIKRAEVVAYPDLGPEAIHRFVVVDFPAYVAVDSHGNDLFAKGRDTWQRTRKTDD